MAKQSIPQKSTKNFVEHYRALLQQKKSFLNQNKYYAIFIVFVLPCLGFCIIHPDVLMSVWSKFKSNEFETLSLSKKNILNKDLNTIFSTSNLYYRPQSGDVMGEEEAIDYIKMSNDEIDINISPLTNPCGTKYIIQNVNYGSGVEVHQVLPVQTYQPSDPAKYLNQNELTNLTFEENVNDKCFIKADDGEGVETFKVDNPTLVVKINNNSGRNMLIHDISVVVKKSRKNLYPNLVFGLGTALKLPIFNEGFGIARNIKMTFNLQSIDEPLNFKGPFKHMLKIAEVKPTDDDSHFYGNSVEQTMRPFFRKELDIDRLEKYVYDLDSLDKYYKMGVFGKFKRGEGRVVGLMSFEGQLPDGTWKRETVKFNFITLLYQLEVGGDYASDYQTVHNIKIRPTEKEYNLTTTVDASIAPNSAGKLNLSFFSGVAAYHLFDIKINYNNKESIVIKNVFLNEGRAHSEETLTKSYNKVAKLSKTK
ncbi:hypothetical protein [Pedobacter cryotolerans]|uniref:Uncharacterized protein n=1 Tax=Pedobacter cryotolerans TaxID=2571270 RepID=A0A4U1CAG0_9SPHI|nr:hypothetical protein [Pedobacter cryotolerans]TKC03463.1 hypothetical protein FA045_02525 [Pedobacter cryotolerans]